MKKLSPDQFPTQLNEITDPPKQLYLEGNLPEENHVWLTVVGSRKYSSYGKEVCEKLIDGLRGYPVVIVSGLALGIDSIAHRAALKAGLKTIAVPGSGLDRSVLYPRSHVGLAEEILQADGALLSEYEPKMSATVYAFPQRNRIMAGLAKAVLLIEATEKSGTLITARLAGDYNRDVLVVPGSIFSPSSVGTHQFLSLGATPITSSEDLLKALGLDTEEETIKDFGELSSDEQKVFEILSVEPLPRDELIQKLNLDISTANTLLSAMEIKGIIIETMGEVRLA